MSSYSTSLKLELMDNGSNSTTWGTVTNTNLGTTLEQAIVGKADITMSSATITLSLTNTNAAQNARAIYLNLTGSPGGAAVLEVPAVQKPYIVKNGSDQQVTIKVTGLTGVVIPVGKTVLVYNNGTDVVTSVDHIPSLTLGAALPVASGGTGITAFGTGVATALGQNVTGSGGIVLATSPTLTTPNLGTPSAATLSNATGLPIDGGTTGTLPVSRGGTGATTLTGVLKGNGTSAVTASNVSLTSEVTGTLPVANGGTGATTLASGQFLKGAGTSAVTTSATVALGSEVSGTLPVANGGTGTTSLTANNVLLGNGTSAVQVVAPGTNGNVLTSNGTTWTSTAIPTQYAGPNVQVFTSAGTSTFTVPSGITKVFVAVWGGGGGGGGGSTNPSGGRGGSGGWGIAYISSGLGASVSVTVGGGGNGGAAVYGGNGVTGSSGSTSSFGSFLSCTGGGGGTGSTNTGGPGTVGAAGTATFSGATTVFKGNATTTTGSLWGSAMFGDPASDGLDGGPGGAGMSGGGGAGGSPAFGSSPGAGGVAYGQGSNGSSGSGVTGGAGGGSSGGVGGAGFGTSIGGGGGGGTGGVIVWW